MALMRTQWNSADDTAPTQGRWTNSIPRPEVSPGIHYSGMEKHRFGQSGVHYSADGRIMTGEREATFPRRNPFPRGRDDASDYRSYDPYRERRRAQRHDDTERRRPRDPSPPPQPQPQPQRRYDRSDYDRRDRYDYDRSYADYRRPVVSAYDRRGPTNTSPDYGYDKAGLLTRRNYHGPGDMQGMLPRKLAYSRDPPMSWTFIVLGGLLLACAVVNVVFCLEDHYYQGFWTGVLVVELGIWGLFHKGKYNTPWKTYIYTFLGTVASLACFVGSAFVLWTLVPAVKSLANYQNVTLYVDRLGLRTRTSNVYIDPETRVWVCLGFDWASMVLLIASMYSMEAGLEVASSLYNVRNHLHRYFHRVDPFCKPAGFNPFVQIPLGQVAAFLGIVSYFVAVRTTWTIYWSPVWAGGLVVLAGAVAAFGLKRPDKTSTNGIGLFLEILAVGGIVCAVILLTLGVVDNINSLRNGTLTGFSYNEVVASVTFLGITILALLANVLFALAVLVKQVGVLLGRDPDSDIQSWDESQESYSVHSRDPYDYDPYLYPQPQYRDWARY